jgi:hypothetical protein
MMKFRSLVEPPKPMRGLEVPPEVVESLGGAKRPPVTITINGHSWKTEDHAWRPAPPPELEDGPDSSSVLLSCHGLRG